MTKSIYDLEEFLDNPNECMTLDLSGKRISDSDCDRIAEILKINNTVTTLNIKQSHISNCGAAVIGRALISNNTLTTLWMNQNEIGDGGAEDLGRCIASNRTLITLWLDQNKIGDRGAKEIAQGLSLNNTLTALWMSQNQIGNNGIEMLKNAGARMGNALNLANQKHLLMPFFTVEGDTSLSYEDVQEVSILIDGNEKISGSNDRAILLMGNTGAGKSTLAHAFCEVGLQAIVNDETGDLLIDALQPLDTIKIGTQMSSETTVPNSCRTSGISIWDCPGFNDTNFVQEIANSFYIKRLVETSGSLKFVLVVCEGDLILTRGNHFVDILERFMKSFTDVSYVEDSISIVITQVAPHKSISHVINTLNHIIDRNKQVSDPLKILIRKVMENHSLHIFHKPREEGEYIYDKRIFNEVDQCGHYVNSKSDMAKIIVSDRAKEYSKHLLETVKNNFNKILLTVVKAISDPEKIVSLGADNVLQMEYELLSKWIPKSAHYDEVSINRPEFRGYFPQLKQIEELREPLRHPANNLNQGVSMMQDVLRVFEKFACGQDKFELRKILQQYSKVLEQQYNYVKFFSEVCGEGLPTVSSFQEFIDLCLTKLSHNLDYKIMKLELDESITEANYYNEAISYLDTQIVHPSCKTVKAKALCKLGEISEFSGDIDKAIHHYAKSIRFDKESPDVYNKIGNLLASLRYYRKAIDSYKVVNDDYEINECFRKWLELEPKSPDVMMARGDYLASISRFDKAKGYYYKAAALYKGPDNQGRKDEALIKIDDIIKGRCSVKKDLGEMVNNHDYYNFDTVNEEFIINLIGEDGFCG